jgi:hypothetical protein
LTNANEDDMIILAKASIPTCNVTPNLGSMLPFNLDRQAHQTRGDIAYGGIATVLTTALRLNIGNLQPLDGERLITLHILRAVGMVFKKQGVYVIHIPGAGRLFPAPLGPHELSATTMI